MHEFQQRMVDGGREIGRVSGRLFESHGCQMDGADVTWMVLGILLWAAVMATLVMTMIALVRHLKGSKKQAKDAKDEKDKK